MPDQFSFVGVVNPLDTLPCFASPIFTDGTRLYLQEIGLDGTIAGFVQVDSLGQRVIRLKGPSRAVGEPPLYAFDFGDGDILVGPRSIVASVLLKREARFHERPFLLLEIAEFLEAPLLRSLALELSTRLLASENRGVARRWSQALRADASVERSGRPYSFEDIAIIGMECRFPGAEGVDEFLSNLREGVESISTFSVEDLEEAGLTGEELQDPSLVPAGGVLQNIEMLDAAFFGISPHQAELTDPQQRLFLEAAWNALESAGYDSESFGGAIGVFASAGPNTYLPHNLASNRDLLEKNERYYLEMVSRLDNLATLVSYKLNLKGPSLTIQSGGSSSLAAVHLACQSLLSRDSDLALAGGVRIDVLRGAGYHSAEGGSLSADGHCRPFDSQAQGTVPGDGVGIVVLRRLEDALKAGDTVRAVIRGSALNNDGSGKVGYTAPGLEGQVRVIREALWRAGVEPESIGYVEAHGSGTPLGDPIEFAALDEVFQRDHLEKGQCALGSVKGNLGHLDAAAGVAGLIRAVLSLEHGQVFPTVHFKSPNHRIDLSNSAFYVAEHLSNWVGGPTPRRAGVSSFGVGGTNAHLILEQAPKLRPASPASCTWQLLPLSARTPTALAALSAHLAEHLRKNPGLALADVAYTLGVRRSFEHRQTVLCRSTDEAVRILTEADPERVRTAMISNGNRPVVFLFSSHGAQYSGMGRGLYEVGGVFRTEFDRCAEFLVPHLGLDLRMVLFPPQGKEDEAAEQLSHARISQPALLAVEYALARQWQGWGIEPEAMLGHSIGEYAAAAVAGVFSIEDALTLVGAWGELMQSQPPAAKLSVALAEEELENFLVGTGVSVAALNTPAVTVLAGPTEAIKRLERSLAERGVASRRLRTSSAYHSPMMESIVGPFLQRFEGIELRPPRIPFVSNVTGTWITEAQATNPGYWAQHLCSPVRFADGLEEILRHSACCLLEVGPGKALATVAWQHRNRAPDQPVLFSLGGAQEEESEMAFLLNTFGQLWLSGVPVDFTRLYTGEFRRRIPLPTYPFERRRYWVEPATQTWEAPGRTSAPGDWLFLPYSDRTTYPRPSLSTPYAMDRNAVEHKLVEIWADVLGLEQVGINDNVFQLGGDSILVARMVAKANKAGLRLSPSDVFEFQTIAELAGNLETSKEDETIFDKGWDEELDDVIKYLA